MAQITMENITKSFGSVKALDGVSLDVRDKEFFVLFGPAGAGKTTILKTIAGVEFPDSGLVRIGGEIVNLVDPAVRNVSMVFENYALYPHMTVYNNIASPMRSPLHRKDEAHIDAEVRRVADLMGIGQFLDRLPSQLSNGQRQRTALGRALVRDPNVFLMDEPLAHLDAKLRHLMRTELKAMQQQFDTTTIYVTHDYAEALSLGDRIAIINRGRIVQVGNSDEIYYTPINEFVARLVGEPEINIFEAYLEGRADNRLQAVAHAGGRTFRFPVPDEVGANLRSSSEAAKIHIGVRGVNIDYRFEPEEGFMPGTVYNLEPIGNKSILTIKIDNNMFQSVAPNDLSVRLDSPAYMYPDPDNMLFFSATDGGFLGRKNQAHLIGRD